jgi:hypothetical protein
LECNPCRTFSGFGHAISYGFYLIIVKELMDKYNAFTFVKWIYLSGFIMVPFGWSQFQTVNWTLVPMDVGSLWWFFDFPDVFIEFALDERIKPTTVVALFIYNHLLLFSQLV